MLFVHLLVTLGEVQAVLSNVLKIELAAAFPRCWQWDMARHKMGWHSMTQLGTTQLGKAWHGTA